MISALMKEVHVSDSSTISSCAGQPWGWSPPAASGRLA